MTGAPGTDPYREWDAAYVLGALAPDERREYEQHLAGCPACREAVGELAGMPALLGAVPREVATAAAPGAVGGDGLAPVVPLAALADRAARRRTRRRTLLGVAAAGLLALGGLGGAAVVGDDAPPVVAGDARTVTLTPVGGSGVTADLTLTSARWGTRLDWWCEYTAAELAEGVYELVVVDADGERSVVGTWSSTGTRTAAGLGASVAVPTDGIRRVELGVVGLDVPLAAADVRAEA